jgi:hypothetical protein
MSQRAWIEKIAATNSPVGMLYSKAGYGELVYVRSDAFSTMKSLLYSLQ